MAVLPPAINSGNSELQLVLSVTLNAVHTVGANPCLFYPQQSFRLMPTDLHLNTTHEDVLLVTRNCFVVKQKHSFQHFSDVFFLQLFKNR